MTVKKLEYSIQANKALIIEYYRGEFCVEELIEFKKKIAEDKTYDPSYNVLSDIKEVTFLFKVDEVKKYIEFISKHSNHIDSRKTAMITQTPNQVVTSLTFDSLKNNLPIDFKVFSTFENAYTFLGLSVSDYELVDRVINKLRNAP